MIDELIVFDTSMERWISAIDTYDGEVDHTKERRLARIFRGQGWREHWQGLSQGRYRLEPPKGTP